jgi:uncharacterized membrane protein HdeD (DUF308 family)
MSEPLVASSPHPHAEEYAKLKPASGMLIFFGAISILVGLLAMSSVVMATMASVFVFGVLLIIAGFFEVIHAITVRNWRGSALHLLAAVMYLLVGVFMLEDPVQAATVITLILAASFLVGGVLRIVFAAIERFASWPWVLLSGGIDILLGLMILNRWPESSLWVIGLFVGIDLLFHGWSSIALGIALRPAAQQAGSLARPV